MTSSGGPRPAGDPSPDPVPAWAMHEAAEELYDVGDAEVITERAKEIARERRQREDERHDEYDDPDEGGEG